MFWIIYCVIFPVAFVAMYKVCIKLNKFMFGPHSAIDGVDRVICSLMALLAASLWPITLTAALVVWMLVQIMHLLGGSVSKFYDWMEK